MFITLTEANFFSKLDAKNKFWFIGWARITIIDHFQFSFSKILLFHLVISRDMFQRKMDMILEKCPGTLRLLNDVDVYGKTRAEYNQNLQNLMKTAQTEGLYFNSDKYTINQKKIDFFGVIYNKNGVWLDSRNIAEIRSLPSPTNSTELQKVLGIITYMAQYIPKLSDITSPLRELLRKDNEYKWTNSQQKSLLQIKHLICNKMILTYFDLTKKSVIQVYVSNGSFKGISPTRRKAHSLHLKGTC